MELWVVGDGLRLGVVWCVQHSKIDAAAVVASAAAASASASSSPSVQVRCLTC